MLDGTPAMTTVPNAGTGVGIGPEPGYLVTGLTDLRGKFTRR